VSTDTAQCIYLILTKMIFNLRHNYDFRTSMEGKAAYVQAERLRGQAGVITNRLACTHCAV